MERMFRMVYLLLAILCSSSIALILKHSENRRMNRLAVTTSNYFTAFMVSLVIIILRPSVSLDISQISLPSFRNDFYNVVIKGSGLFSEGSSLIWAVTLGLVTGIFFFLSFIYYQKSVNENGASLSGTFGKLGILIPMLSSILIWKEIPNTLQWLGIILAIASILMVNLSFNSKTPAKINLTLILLFLFGGIAEFQNKLFQKYAIIEYKDIFLFFVFFMAFLISLVYTIKSGKEVKAGDIFTGLLVGIPNLFSSYFLILALGQIPTSAAFPAYSAGSIVFISIGSLLLYKERLTLKNKFAIFLVIISLILINL
jgi:multidrug transporter EmrE-like cation transporter